MVYRLSVRVGIETLQSHVNAHLFAGGLVVDLALCLDGELDRIAIRPLHETDPLDL